MRRGITVYDASYVALSGLLGVPLLYTADEVLVRKIGAGSVRRVGDFEP